MRIRHKWISFLMGLLVLFDLPFEILRYIDAPLIQEFFSQLIYLMLQSALYYFWLSNFELLHRKVEEEQGVSRKWTAFKVGLISVYTVPQALMSFYIFYKKESKSEFDPRSEIFFYAYYIKVRKQGD